MTKFDALPGFYQLLYLYIEPVSTTIPALMAWIFPGAAWFHHELIPSSAPLEPGAVLEPRTLMAVWQLANCYVLLGLISSLVFRATRDALPHDPIAQERIVGASLTALAIADVTHILVTFFGLPQEVQLKVSAWNPMTHGNISVVILLLCGRLAWFLGIGRKRYYYGQKLTPKADKTS